LDFRGFYSFFRSHFPALCKTFGSTAHSVHSVRKIITLWLESFRNAPKITAPAEGTISVF